MNLAGKEILWDNEYIISETDSKGIITYASESFIRISGYSKDELLGKPHNIVRHPDMPRAAFKMVWDDIQTKGYWRGIVKNMTKSGDYYWVESTILRNVLNDGSITYFSIRTVPKREQISRAAAFYATLK